MILSNQDLFSDRQAITATAASTNVIDSGAPGVPAFHTVALEKDLGKSRDLPLFLNVVEAFNNLTSLQVSIEVDDNVGFASPKTVALSRAFTLAELTLGQRLNFPARIPEGTDEQFLRLKYTVVGTAPTLGKISAGITPGRQTAA